MARQRTAFGSLRVFSGHDSWWRTPSYGQDVPKPIRHEHVVWGVHPVSGELHTRGFGDGSLARAREATGTWGIETGRDK